MAKNKENPKKSPETEKESVSKKAERQQKLVAKLEKAYGEKPSDELELQLNRERDTLRHLNLVQKEKPKDRAESKYLYAAKAALSRAIQPIEE